MLKSFLLLNKASPTQSLEITKNVCAKITSKIYLFKIVYMHYIVIVK